MAIQVGEAFIPVKPDMSDFGKQVETGTKQATGKLKSFAKTAAVTMGGAFAATKVKDFFGTAIGGAREAIEIDKQTEAVIKSTGGAAGITAEHVETLSNKLQKQQTISDEMVQSGANLLLTFKDIRNEAGEGNNVFDRTVELAGDMSVALGQDMKSSSIQLGKALNDPVRGVSALQEVGVSFTEQQKEQIKSMQENGDLLGAQTMILGELESQFAGSASAQADAGKKMSLAWSDFQEVVGRAVLPLVDKLLGVLTKVADWAAANPGKFKAIAAVVGGALVLAFTAWAISAASAAAATIAAAAPVIAIGVAIGALVAAIIWAYNEWDFFRNVVDAVASFLTNTVWPAIQAGARWFTETLIPAIGDVIGWFGDMASKLASVASTVGEKVGDIVSFVTGIPGRISSTVATLWDGIRDGITDAKDWVSDRIGDIVSFITDLPGKVSDAAAGAFDGLSGAAKSAFNAIIRFWNNTAGKISFDFPSWVPGVGGKGFSMPTFSELHQGGHVTPFGVEPLRTDEILAKLQVGETVLPRDFLAAGGAESLDPAGSPLVGGDFVVQVMPGEDGIRKGMHELRRLQLMAM